MPCSEEIPKDKNLVSNSVEIAPAPAVSETVEVPETTVREISQTDRINSHLLKAFLNQINSGNVNELVSGDDEQDGNEEDEFAD